MVILVFMLIFMPISVHAISADDLRELVDVWDDKERQRSGRIETKALGDLIPKSPKKPKIDIGIEAAQAAEKPVEQHEATQAPAKQKKPKKVRRKKYAVEDGPSEKMRHPKRAKATKVPVSGEPQGRGAMGVPPKATWENAPKGMYFSPPQSGGYNTQVDAVKPPTQAAFGIRIGRWIEGELKRSATNAEPGLIEIYTRENVEGKSKLLPSGTTLFAQKSYNSGNKKLDLMVVKGITPDGLEFEMQGLVFDLQQSAGLMGIVSTDSDMIVERSASKGFLAAGASATRSIADTTVIGAAANGAAESFLNDSNDSVQRSKTLKQTIRSAPQRLLIRVEETF